MYPVYFCKEAPPFPVTELKVALNIPLYDSDGSGLLNTFLEIPKILMIIIIIIIIIII